jgi:SAM-dependent methyltransferase
VPRLPRKKPRNVLASVLHRLKPVLPLNFLLDMAAVSQRLAFEKAQPWPDNPFLHKHIKPTDHVVEIGCSSGRVLSVVHAARRTGIDREEAAIKRGRKAHPEITFLHGDATGAPAGDVVIFSHVLEHIDDPAGLLRSLNAERIYVEVPDFEASLLNAVRLQRGRMIHTDEDHVAEFTRDELEELFAECRLKVIDAEFRWGVMRYWLSRSAT